MATYDITKNALPSVLSRDDIINCPFTGSYKTVTLPKAKYKLECWGAQGKSLSSSVSGGKGGYSKGILELLSPTTLYLYIGGSPTNGTGGFNGGGSGAASSSCGGGGGTDIRINSTSLYARVIVAGGGGGACYSSYKGGYGGGTTGGQGGSMGTNGEYAGNPGTQTSGGIGKTTNSNGGFGIGGNGYTTQSTSSDLYKVAGGGGGWYGGSGGHHAYASGCGGSGYVYTASTASNYPSGCRLNSSYYLTDANTYAGDTAFIDPDTGSSVIGRSGNGYIRITVLEVGQTGSIIPIKINSEIKNSNEQYIKINNQWKLISGVYVKINNIWKQHKP